MLGQQLVNGLALGSTYALFALGLTLVFGIQRVLNLAHGAILMWGAVIGVFAVTELALPFVVAAVVAGIAAGLLNVVVDFVAFRPLRKRGSAEFGSLVTSIGASLILVNLSQRATGAQIVRFPRDAFANFNFTLLGARISAIQLTIILVGAALMLLLLAYLYKTSLGRQARAVAIRERTALLLGIPADWVYLQTFFTSGALAGITGVLVGVAYNSIHSLMGDALLLHAFVVVVIGGLGSIAGAMVGGLAMGFVQTFLIAYTSSELVDAAIFTALILLLLVRPQGIFPGLHHEAGAPRS
jgi:branched-chain amino acid transport system permease protein